MRALVREGAGSCPKEIGGFTRDCLRLPSAAAVLTGSGVTPRFAALVAGARKLKEQPIEPLTNRELDVLELPAERLHYKETAERLSISLATVKTHLEHIYGRLDVPNRRQAVIKAEELGVSGKG